MIMRSILTLAVLLISSHLTAKVKFTERQLETDFKITHPVMAANLAGSQNDQIILLGETEKKERILAVYSLEVDCSAEESEQYTETARIVIPNDYLTFDILKTADKEKLLFQSNQAIFEFNLGDQKFHKLVDSNSIYLRPKAQYLAQRKIVKDLNGDELGDIFIPDFRQVHLYLQEPGGSFTQQSIPISPKINMNNDSATYAETPLYFADFNLDQKPDLIVVKDASLDLYLQNGNGTFHATPNNVAIPIDFKALNWWEIREADGESLDQNALSYRTVTQFEDINNDDIVDLLIRFSQTEGVLDRQNNYEVYLGKAENGFVTYNKDPDSTLAVDGTTIDVKIIDLNGDDKSEIVLSSLDIGVSQIIGALLTGSIDQDVYVFKMNGEDKYDEDPKVNKEVDMNFSLSSGKSGEPVIQVADFDGDGLKDLMLSDGEKTLKVFEGTTKKNRMLKRRSKKHKVLLPKDGDLVETKDLNKDGKNDVIIRYGRQDEKELHNKLVILFAS